MSRLPPRHRTGRIICTVAVAAWIAAAGALLPSGKKLPDVTNDEFVLPASSQTAQLHRIVSERFAGGDQRTAVIVYRRAAGLTAADRRTILADAQRIAKLPDVGRPIPAFAPGAPPELVSSGHDVALMLVPIAAGKVFHVTPTIEALRRVASPRGGLDVHVTGFPALVSDINSAVRDADLKLLLVTALLVLTLLIGVYRSPVLALVPLVVVGVAYVATTGFIYLLNRAIDLPVDSTSRSLLLVLMFGAGTDYCLLFVARYRAALVHDENPLAAVRAALPDAAPAILASGFTVIGAMLAMLGAVFGILRTLGPVNAIGIGMVLLSSLTLLPALLALLGRAAFWPQKSGARTDDVDLDGAWGDIGRMVRAKPAAWLAGAIMLLGVAAGGLAWTDLGVSPIPQFRASADAVAGYNVIKTAFPAGAVNPTTVLVARDNGRVSPQDLGTVAKRIESVPGVAAIRPTGRVARDGSAAEMTLVFADDPFLEPALDRVELLRSELRDVAPGVTVLLGEGSAERLDYKNGLARDTKVVVPLLLLVVMVALVALLRSVVAPLYLLATVVLSVAGALGASLFAFEHIFGQEVDRIVPLIIFIFLVALGADYNIFLMSRVREEALEDNTREGMLRALVATGPVITSAGVILAGTFAVLTVLPLNLLFQTGFGVALGILIDTFLVRTLCVPAITWLTGERSWWPSVLRPARDRVAASTPPPPS